MPTLITFESWVTLRKWYAYAKASPLFVPHLLVDRSQCIEPFLDHFTPIDRARPLLSGLCRPNRRYKLGERVIYLTRVDRKVLADLGRVTTAPKGAVYFGVAALHVATLHPSHEVAAATFGPARYTASPNPSDYPPNLAHLPYPGASAELRSCITHDISNKGHTPLTATPAMHRAQYNVYRKRQIGRPVAECVFDSVDGHVARVLDPHKAPLLSAADWGGRQMNVNGLRISEADADTIAWKIAHSNL